MIARAGVDAGRGAQGGGVLGGRVSGAGLEGAGGGWRSGSGEERRGEERRGEDGGGEGARKDWLGGSSGGWLAWMQQPPPPPPPPSPPPPARSAHGEGVVAGAEGAGGARSESPPGSGGGGGMRVTVKTLTGKAFEVHVHPATSLLRLKHIILQEEGIPVEQQRLIVQGKALEDDSLPLRAANVTHATVIHLVLRSLPPSLPQSRSQLLIALVGVWACAVLQCRMRACERVVHADEESVERRESIGGEAGGKGGGYARHAQRAEEEAQGSAR